MYEKFYTSKTKKIVFLNANKTLSMKKSRLPLEISSSAFFVIKNKYKTYLVVKEIQ